MTRRGLTSAAKLGLCLAAASVWMPVAMAQNQSQDRTGPMTPITRPSNPNGFGVRVPLQTTKPFAGGFANPWGINKTSTPLTRNLVTLPTPSIPRVPGWTHGPKRPAVDGRPWHRDRHQRWDNDHGHWHGDGLHVDGHHSGDKWKVRFHLGSGSISRRHGFHCAPIYWPTYGSLWYNYPLGWYEYADAYYRPTIDGYYAPADPNLYDQAPPAEEVVPTTPLDRGRWQLIRGQYRDAVKSFTTAVNEQSSPETLRWLGVGLLMDKKPQEAAAVIASAYASDPTLAQRPLEEDALADREEFREARTRASRHANSLNSASSWMTLVVLLQAEGKNDAAIANLKKAKALGLDPALASAFESALK